MNAQEKVALNDILLVEDSFADVMLMREAVEEVMPHTRLSVAGDGVEALRLLRREGEYAAAPRPELVLLDLNMPRKGGLDVLRDVRSDPALKGLPVLVLSTSDAWEDVKAAYERGANAYLVKPRDLPGFFELLGQLRSFWFTAARLPSGRRK